MLKKIICILLLFCLFANVSYANELSCKSALLMDYYTGEVLFKLNPHEKLAPASVTKIMTLLLAMEEIDKGNLKYDDIVVASSYAKSMGGSTIFLDEGEQMSVKDILKGIAVSSGNDACVAIAEHICGSTGAFVEKMNVRAKELNMTNTNFVNCNGLDDDNHYSTAYDIALMSRELMKHSDIFDFTGIWMDSLRNGEFTLSNTNKLIRFYEGATGLKTGSTSKAGFCISATAYRNDMHLIAVIMNSPTSKERQRDASSLLNYGFSTYSLKTALKANEPVPDIPVARGVKDFCKVKCTDEVKILSKKDLETEFEINYNIPEIVKAPLKRGDIIGEAVCVSGEKIIGKSPVVICEDVKKVNFKYAYGKIIDNWLGNK